VVWCLNFTKQCFSRVNKQIIKGNNLFTKHTFVGMPQKASILPRWPAKTNIPHVGKAYNKRDITRATNTVFGWFADIPWLLSILNIYIRWLHCSRIAVMYISMFKPWCKMTPKDLIWSTNSISSTDGSKCLRIGQGRLKTISLVYVRFTSAHAITLANSSARSTSQCSGTRRLMSSAYLLKMFFAESGCRSLFITM